mmetsp:Transcript_9453/g.20450  ORF Transcript_9453/g.20450 Transcript_9453/m.20450 type:complete len:215 (+) Transcript_9453:959-1603(+)
MMMAPQSKPSLLEREITPTIQNYQRKDNGNNHGSDGSSGRQHRKNAYHWQDTDKRKNSMHNRDETLVAHNLRSKNGKELYHEDEEHHDNVVSHGVLATDDANEKTGLLQKQYPHGKNNASEKKHPIKNLLNNMQQLILPSNTNPSKCTSCDANELKSTTLGSFLFSLYCLVFSFAEASAITRPSHYSMTTSQSLLGPMALMACIHEVSQNIGEI